MLMNRFFSVLAAAALIAGLFALSAFADFKLPAPNPSSANTTKTALINGFYLADDGTYAGCKGDSAATSATACFSDNWTTQTSGTIHSFRTGGSEKSTVNYAGTVLSPGLDAYAAGALAIGAATATSVVITPATTITGAATLSSTAAITGALSANGGVDRSTAAALAIGPTNATAVNVTPVLNANGGVDRSTAAALTIGGTNATSVTVGKAGSSNGTGWRNAASRIVVANKPTAPVDVSGGVTATVTQMLEAGLFTSTGTANLTLPTMQGASGLIQALPGTPAVGDIFEFTVACSHATQVVTIVAGTGVTLFGIATTAPGGGSRTWHCRVTAVTASSETATCY